MLQFQVVDKEWNQCWSMFYYNFTAEWELDVINLEL